MSTVIYEKLNNYASVDYDIVSEEYKVINNVEYYYLTIKLRIGEHKRIGIAKFNVDSSDYKSAAIEYALARAYLIMPNVKVNNVNNTNNDNNINNTNVNKTNNINNVNNINNTNNQTMNSNNNTNNTNNVNNTNNTNNAKRSAFTSETLNRLKDFQIRNNIKDGKKLLSFLNTWNASITDITDLDEYKLREFLNWANA